MLEGEAAVGPRPALVRRNAFEQQRGRARNGDEDENKKDAQEHAASLIEAHERGMHARQELYRKRRAALLIEKVQRGHSSRLRSHNKHGVDGITLTAPLRLAILGCEWSGASELASRLSRQLSVPCFQSTADLSRVMHDTRQGIGHTSKAGQQDAHLHSWIIDATREHATELEVLHSLPLPPTHWVRCSVDDEAAEAVALATMVANAHHTVGDSATPSKSNSISSPATALVASSEGAAARRAAVKRHLREWKVEMLAVYKRVLPASEFVRVDASGPGGIDHQLTRMQEEVLAAVLPPPEAQSESYAGGEPRKFGAEGGRNLAARMQMRREQRARTGGLESTPHQPFPIGVSGYEEDDDDNDGDDGLATGHLQSDAAGGEPAADGRYDRLTTPALPSRSGVAAPEGGPLLYESDERGGRSRPGGRSGGERQRPAELVDVSSAEAALERVSSIADHWRSRSLLARLSRCVNRRLPSLPCAHAHACEA